MDIKKIAVPTLFTLLVFSILVGLGVWQIKRLAWKQDLIAKLEERAQATPETLGAALSRLRAGADVAYSRVTLSGAFLHDDEIHLYSLAGGRAGWRVITPLRTLTGAIVFVDRGFVPHKLKGAAARSEGQTPGQTSVIGQIRLPDRKTALAPENDPAKNEWYWRDLEAMAGGLAPGSAQAVVPLIVEAEAATGQGEWPKAGVVRVKPSNRHLGYAVTWFALAAVLLVIYGVFVRNLLRRA